MLPQVYAIAKRLGCWYAAEEDIDNREKKGDGIRCELMMQGEREMAEKGKVGHVGHMKSYLI